VVDPSTWERTAAITAVLDTGRVPDEDAWSTFNMGIGMCLILPRDAAATATAVITGARVIGRVEEGEGGLRFG
jgi:phosphoribosylformylglycinamidine cyclo-ligase